MTTLLSVAGLSRRYGPLTAVDNFDLRLSAGARHAIVGANGAGKSTLLNLIAGTIHPSGGRITFTDRDITHASPRRRAGLGIARTFQQPAVLGSLSVLDNLRVAAWRHLGPNTSWRPSHHRALTSHCLHQLHTLGLTTQIRHRAGTLSHGQRRLLDLATALVAQPQLLLLDEPAAGLADADLDRLHTTLKALPSDMAVLLVDHDLPLVSAITDTVTVMHDGQMLHTGTPTTLYTDPMVRQLYLGTAAVD